MADKIKELLETGTMSKLKNFTQREENIVCKDLERVWGIGPKKAKEFYDQGVKTVEDLRKRPDLITSKNMAIGLKYFEELQCRIPREKVTRIYELLKRIFFGLVHSDRMHHIEIVGSYRRLRPTCGDIDVLICRHDGSVESNLLRNYVQELEENGFITESLSQPRVFDGRNNSAYMGVCLFEDQHHRIDIKHYPVEQYAFALMYFTGSDLFNRQMRMKAHNRGLLLSDHGLKMK
jgi:DNA polymerase/3'-5' exonuclease PolX